MTGGRGRITVCTVALAIAGACGGDAASRSIQGAGATGSDSATIAVGEGSPSSAMLSSGLGELAVDLMDQPAPEVKEVVVTVTSVTVHVAGKGWLPLMKETLTVDLLTLKDRAERLGLLALPPGKVTQIRLLLAEEGHYVTTVADERAILKVPSGYQSGIKIIGSWEVTACARTAITIDFDGEKSIWYHPTGQGEPWILRPVIRVRGSESTSIPCPPPPEEGVPGEEGPPPDEGTPGEDPGGGGTPIPVGIGGACSSVSACDEGLSCVGGTCVGTIGNPCASASECASESCVLGTCAPGGAGAACGVGLECLSGACSAGTCEVGPPSAPCAAPTDCTTGVCFDGSCGRGTTGGSGEACGASSACASNVCTEGTCQPGYQGSPCSQPLDCQTGLTCEAGACVPAAL